MLRVARFAARFAPLGFTIAPETLQLMQDIVRSGELRALVAERVWVETERALGEKTPAVYFEVLRQCGALAELLPEVDCLFGVPQPEKWHPEIDTGLHTLQVLDVASELSSETTVRFAALVHDLGKGVTPRDQWPRHIGHEQAGVRVIGQMCERLKVPTEHRELGQLVSREHQRIHRAAELRDTTVLEVLEAADAFRRPERFDKLLLACEADARGRGPELRARTYPQAQFLSRLFQCCGSGQARRRRDAAAGRARHCAGAARCPGRGDQRRPGALTTLDVTLQRVPQVPRRKPSQRRRVVLRQRDDLESFAHFARQREDHRLA